MLCLQWASWNLSNRQVLRKKKIFRWGTKNDLFEFFWDIIRESYRHIWNEHPQICHSSRLYAKTYKKKKFSIWDQKWLIWVFLGWHLKKFLSCLKLAPLNLRKWKLYCWKNRTLNLRSKMSYLGILGKEFGKSESLFILIKAIQVKQNLVAHYKGRHQTNEGDRQNGKFLLEKYYIGRAYAGLREDVP